MSYLAKINVGQVKGLGSIFRVGKKNKEGVGIMVEADGGVLTDDRAKFSTSI